MELRIYPTIKKASELTGKTQKEIRDLFFKKYGKRIKTNCCVCGNVIKYSVARYYAQGNTCQKCNYQVSSILKARKIHRRLVANSQKLEDDTQTLRQHLKANGIPIKELFLSIKFHNSAITILDAKNWL